MFLTFRFFIVCLIISITKARPSRLKILPGLAFYRTEDGQSDNENSLMDRDKDLLRSMWNIVDKMDYRNRENVPQVHSDSVAQAGDRSMDVMRKSNTNSSPTKLHKLPSVHNVQQHHTGPHGAKLPPLGTPITTINVFSTYPAAVKGEHPYPVPAYQSATFGATPFTSSSATHNGQNLMHHTNPRFDLAKSIRNAYEQFMTPSNNPIQYEAQGIPPQENLMSQHQFNPVMNQNGGQAFEHPMDNSEMGQSLYDSGANREEMGQSFAGVMGGGMGMERQAESEPMQFLMPQMGSDVRAMGDMMREMPDSMRQQNNY